MITLEDWEIFQDRHFRRQEINYFLNRLLKCDNFHCENASFAPAAELQETDSAFYLKLEVPGMAKQKIKVELTCKAVTISGSKKPEPNAEDKRQILGDINYGSWRRTIPLPSPVVAKSAIAEYTDGILSLVLPKETARSRSN